MRGSWLTQSAERCKLERDGTKKRQSADAKHIFVVTRLYKLLSGKWPQKDYATSKVYKYK